MSIIKYRPEIDGLRALAVIPVVLFHLGCSWIKGGFAGVDVFFVISGYLISLIILREQQQGTFSFKAFWTRRARRILPALSSMVLACMIAGFFISLRFDWKALGGQGLSVFALIANFNMWKLAGNYWAPAAHETPLLHTWSLAVEEQFYLFYPLLLISLLKFAKKYVFRIILAGTILSFVLGMIVTQWKPAAAFYLLPPRAWELAAGCLLAISSHNRASVFSKGPLASILSLGGVILIAFSYLLITEERGFPGYQALFPVLGAIMVIAFTSAHHLTGRILASPPVCYLGKISYSLYLWHWPVIVYARIIKQQYQTTVPIGWIVVLSLGLSVMSYHFIEKTTRFSKNWAIPTTIITISSIGLCTGMYAWPIHYDFSGFAPVKWSGRLYDVTPLIKPWDGFMKERMTGIIAPMREPLRSQAFSELGIVKNYGSPDPEIVVFGDSHALMWSSTIDEICQELGRNVSFFAADGTSPDISVPAQRAATNFFSADEKFLLDSARLRILTDTKPKLVILAARYSGAKSGVGIENLLSLITQSGAKCIIIEQPPMLPFGDKNALAYCAELTRKSSVPLDSISMPLGEPENWTHGKLLVDTAAKKFPAARVLNIADLYLNSSQQVVLMDRKNVCYIDDDHLSDFGAMKAKVRIKAAMSLALAR